MHVRRLWVTVAVLCVVAGAAVTWGQQVAQHDADAARAVVGTLWTAISRGDVDGIVACMRFPVTLVEVSADDQPGLVEAVTEAKLRGDLAKLPRNANAPRVVLAEVEVKLAGRQMACVLHRLPANTAPFVGPEGPSAQLLTVLAKSDGKWKVIATALPM